MNDSEFLKQFQHIMSITNDTMLRLQEQITALRQAIDLLSVSDKILMNLNDDHEKRLRVIEEKPIVRDFNPRDAYLDRPQTYPTYDDIEIEMRCPGGS